VISDLQAEASDGSLSETFVFLSKDPAAQPPPTPQLQFADQSGSTNMDAQCQVLAKVIRMVEDVINKNNRNDFFFFFFFFSNKKSII
jgi:hypothetical protein